MDMESYIQLTKEQSDAVNAPLPTVVLSCAGTGKTTTMIERIIKAKNEDNIPLSKMFVSTFTRYASQEMTKRLVDKIDDSPEYIGTFHRNCIRLYKKFPRLLSCHGYKVQTLKYVTAVDAERIILSILEKYKDELKQRKLSIQKIKRIAKESIDTLKNEGIYPIDYHCYKATDSSVLNTNIKILNKIEGFDIDNDDMINAMWNIFTEYQTALKDSNILDINDIIALPVFAMNDVIISNTVSSNFKLVIIDEFQDSSKMQFELIKKLSHNYKNAFLVGDEDQLLYEWRDADLKKVMSFYTNQNFNVRLLEGNFRSQKPIIDLSVALITQNKNRSSKIMKPMREIEDPNSVIFLQPYDDKFEAYLVAKSIKKLLNEDVAAEQIAIIFANKYYRFQIEQALKNEKIDYNFVKGYGFYEYAEVKKMLSYLTLALDNSNELALDDIINFPKRAIGPLKITNMKLYANKHKLKLYDAVKKFSVADDFIKIISKLQKLMAEGKRPIEVLGYLTKEIKLHDYLVREYGDAEADDKFLRVQQLQEVLDNLVSEFGSYERAITELWEDIFSINKETIKDKVQLMTAYSSKGLEFENVFIIGAINGNFPSFKSDSKLESSRRVFYVATTRAKDLLVISSPKYLHKNGTVVECQPTMFLKGLDNYYEAISCNELEEYKEYSKDCEPLSPSGEMFVGSEPEGFYT